MEHTLLLIQARLLQWSGLFWLLAGLLAGKDPLRLAWQAAVVGLLCMVIGGVLLRIAVKHVGGFIADQLRKQLEAAQAHEGETA